MLGVFPPAISTAIDCILGYAGGTLQAGAVQDAITSALQWNRRARAIYDYWKTSAPLKDAEIASIMERIERYFAAREETLRDMAADCAQENAHALVDKVKDLKESSIALTDLTLALRKQNRQKDVYSPVPTVDDLIKTGINVYTEAYPPDALKVKIPTVIALKKEYDLDVSLFEKYFPDETALIEKLKQDLYYLEQSIGAVYSFIESGDRGDLLTGLKALGIASTQMARDLLETQQVRKSKGLSSNPIIDEFLKDALARSQGELSDEDFERSFQGMRSYVQNTWGDMQRFFRDFFVRRAVGEKYYALFAEQVRTLEETLEALRRTQSKDLLDKLGSTFEKLLDTRQSFYKDALVEKELSKDLDIEELRDIMKAVKDGVLHTGALQEKLIKVSKRAAEAVRKLEFLPEYDELKGLKEILVGQQKAYEAIGFWFADRNPLRLLAGIEEMENNFEAYLDGEAKIESWMKYVNWVVCGNCGHSNFPDERACTECRTPLPEPGRYQDGYLDLRMTKDDEVYLAGDASGVSSEGLRLKKTVEGYFNGDISAGQLKEYLDYLQRKVNSIKCQFVQRVLPSIRQNPGDRTLQEMGEEFHNIFVSFEQSLEDMFAYFSDNDPVRLKEGMQAMLHSDHALLCLNQEAMRIVQNTGVS
jgi:hypothetical protein